MSISQAEKRSQITISLQVKPLHQEVPSLTGSPINRAAGTVLYGYYSMDYHLPGGDFLRLLANHNKSHVQILLLTKDPRKLQHLPGERPSSLVASTISCVNRYLVRSDHYAKPRTASQEAKYQFAQNCIYALCQLLEEERELSNTDWKGQETLRKKVIAIIETCRNENRLLANHPIVSEGTLGNKLYEARQSAQHYQFNRVYPVSRLDQLDFTEERLVYSEKAPCYIWDSEVHIGSNQEALNDTLRVICQQYGLEPAEELNHIVANRFTRFERYFRSLWKDGKDWITHLAKSENPKPVKHVETRSDGLSITTIKPYYHFQGFEQRPYHSLRELITHFTGEEMPGFMAESLSEAEKLLTIQANKHWVKIDNKNQVIVRLNNKMVILNYYEENQLFHLLPSGDDLYTLSQISKRHLYLPDRINLSINAFFSRIPLFFRYIYQHLYQFVTYKLHDELVNHIHAEHLPIVKRPVENIDFEPNPLNSLRDVLVGHGLLSTGQTLEEFVKQQISDSHYIIVREQHPKGPPDYDNPLHRTLGILRHLGSFFIDASEKNPIIGFLGLTAYAYGGCAVVAPEALASILAKLHLKGLISGIKPTQELAKWMSHGTLSEAISAAVTCWQAIILSGDLDKFFIQAVSVLHEDPAQVAIIVALAIGLGQGICQAIPSFQDEMGRFPYLNYAALGAKGGAAIYDTVMHPGDDWLLGTSKWLLQGGVTLIKIFVSPFIEAYYYGFYKGFSSGWQKSFKLFIQTIKQSVVALIDLSLTLATIPLLEISTLFIHIPFRGTCNLLSKTLKTLGNWKPIGEALINFAHRETGWNFLIGFRLSPLYGFSNPIRHHHDTIWLNMVLNTSFLFLSPLQLLKNCILLPTMDFLFLSIRLSLTVLNPISRITAMSLGTLISKSSFIWDNSAGLLLCVMANSVTRVSNWIDMQAGGFKQFILGHIQVWQKTLYHWAFSQEDIVQHFIHTDKEYFQTDPMRLEQLPHDSTHCLLELLLRAPINEVLPSIKDDEDNYSALFKASSPLERRHTDCRVGARDTGIGSQMGY